MRSGIAKNANLVAALSALDQAIARHYLDLVDSPCC
jgi:hypothetical protein